MSKIDSQTRIYGIIGYPLSHTFSPAMHNAAFEKTGINAVYLAFPMKNLLNLKRSMKQFSISGLSVTIPYKVKVRRNIDTIDPLALQIGCVNTLIWEKGLLKGYNTDGAGAVEALIQSGFTVRGKKILIIGSGGSARSIMFSLLQMKPAKVAFLGRNIKAMRTLSRGAHLTKSGPQTSVFWMGGEKSAIHYSYESVLQSPRQLEEFDLVIQTTPMGMNGHPDSAKSPLGREYFFAHQTYFDIVYNPQVTPFVKLAKAKKAIIVPGYKMLLYQGVRQFEIFTGKKAPVDVMEQALLRQLKGT